MCKGRQGKDDQDDNCVSEDIIAPKGAGGGGRGVGCLGRVRQRRGGMCRAFLKTASKKRQGGRRGRFGRGMQGRGACKGGRAQGGNGGWGGGSSEHHHVATILAFMFLQTA